MTRALLTDADQKEGLSIVYVKALATRAGFVASKPNLDRDSVDLHIQASGPLRPALDLQLKATADFGKPRNGSFSFRLKIKNYNDLRIETQTPRLLVVLELPSDESQWMTVSREELILRRRAYWLSLQRGHSEIIGQETITVRIPQDNVFDVAALNDLMERSRLGKI